MRVFVGAGQKMKNEENIGKYRQSTVVNKIKLPSYTRYTTHYRLRQYKNLKRITIKEL